jgi:pimeloyl-ACP methyl ester carboxylesterase
MMIYSSVIGEGYPLVFLHAMGTDHRAMQAWVEPLFSNRQGYQRIYLDLPAHGQSRVADWVKTSDDLLSMLLDELDSLLADRRFSLVAKSFGGYMAQGIFHHRSEQVDGLCLLAPALHLKDRILPSRVILERDEDLMSSLETDIATAVDTLFTVQSRENIEAFLQEVQPGRLLADRVFLNSEWRTKGYFFSFEPIHHEDRYPQPVQFILGKEDPICGYQDHLTLSKAFPQASCSILDHAGHMLDIEQRSTVQSIFANWLERVTP